MYCYLFSPWVGNVLFVLSLGFYEGGKTPAEQSNVASRVQTAPLQVLLKDKHFHGKISLSVFKKHVYNKGPEIIHDDKDTDMKSHCSNLLTPK